MILIIAEKPSVAQTIAAVLGAKEKKDGFLTGSGYIVSWCVKFVKPKQNVKGNTDLEDFDFEDYDEDEPEADTG